MKNSILIASLFAVALAACGKKEEAAPVEPAAPVVEQAPEAEPMVTEPAPAEPEATEPAPTEEPAAAPAEEEAK